MDSPWSRRLLAPLALLAVLAGLWWLSRPAAVEVEVAQVRRGELRMGFREEGRTRAREPFLLSAPVAGQIDRIALEPGAELAAGQVLVRLRPAAAVLLDDRSRGETRARLAAARAAATAAQRQAQALAAERQQARADASRLDQMPNLIAQAERERARSRALALDAQVAAADADVLRARNEVQALQTALSGGDGDNAGLIELTAPIAGRLLVRHLQSAQLVAAGQPLLELAALDDLEVEVEVLSEDAVTLAVGGAVELRRWGGPDALVAHVRSIDPQGFRKISALGVEEQRTRVYVGLDSPLAARPTLGVGYAVDAYFIRQRLPDVLLVPGSAVLHDSGAAAVLRIVDGRARRIAVQVLGENDEDAALNAELAEGQPVVAHPDDRVDDGVRVRGVQVSR